MHGLMESPPEQKVRGRDWSLNQKGLQESPQFAFQLPGLDNLSARAHEGYSLP